jgi:hypothetical protein
MESRDDNDRRVALTIPQCYTMPGDALIDRGDSDTKASFGGKLVDHESPALSKDGQLSDKSYMKVK